MVDDAFAPVSTEAGRSSYVTTADVEPLICRFGREAPGKPVPNVWLSLGGAMFLRKVDPFGPGACVSQMPFRPRRETDAAVATPLAFSGLSPAGPPAKASETVARGTSRDDLADGVALTVGQLWTSQVPSVGSVLVATQTQWKGRSGMPSPSKSPAPCKRVEVRSRYCRRSRVLRAIGAVPGDRDGRPRRAGGAKIWACRFRPRR